MSSNPPSNRKKRTASDTNSFVNNVKSKVSALLSTSLTKWFRSPNSQTNGSVPKSEVSDSSTEDEASEIINTAPPAKRMRYDSIRYNQYPDTDVNFASTSSADIPDQNLRQTITQSSSGRNTGRRDTSVLTTTSLHDRDYDIFSSQPTGTSKGKSVTLKRKSLFNNDDRNVEPEKTCEKSSWNTFDDLKKPSFKPSLLGSPFYCGRTTYGGAAASYMNKPVAKEWKVTCVNETKNDESVNMSQSARRVMELLEQYSSPLAEAKRIKQYTSYGSHSNNRLDISKSSAKSSHNTQELYIPSVASVLRLKKKSRLMEATKTARQIIASHSSATDYISLSSSKITRDERENQKTESSHSTQESDDMVDSKTTSKTPVIPSSEILLPKLKSALDKTTVTGISTKPERNVESVIKSTFRFSSPVKICGDSSDLTTKQLFSYGSPERNIGSPPKYSRVTGTGNEQNTDPISNKVLSKLTKKSNMWQCNDCWVSNEFDVDKCVCCGGQKSSKNDKPAKCSICKLATTKLGNDKCFQCTKIQTTASPSPNTSNAKSIVKADLLKWKCKECWVSNNESDKNCACCGADNPKHTTVATKNDWKCNDCWVVNKNDIVKCVACGSPRPGVKESTKPSISAASSFKFGIDNSKPLDSTKPSDSSFKNIVNSQSNKWECPNCFVRNENDRSQCICCETEKDGNSKKQKSNYNFGISNTSFKFGIGLQQEHLKEKTDDQEKITTIESERDNTLDKTPKFTIPASMPTNVEKTAETPKINFSFGIPNQTAISSVQDSPKLQEEKEKVQEVPQIEVTSANQESPKPLSISQENSSMALSNSEKPAFGSIPLFNSEPKPKVSEAQDKALAPVVSCVLTKQNTFTFAASGMKTSMNMFSSATPDSNRLSQATPLKSTSTTSTVTSLAPAMSLFQKPEAAFTIPSFTNPSSVSSPSQVPLFQRSDQQETTTVSTGIGAVKAPLFSFGSTNPAPNIDKPKFSFTFGAGNNPETTTFKPNFPASESALTSKADVPVFQGTFGASTQITSTSNNPEQTMFKTPFGGLSTSSGASNTFALSPANEMGPNKIVSGTMMGTSNTLPTNPLVVNTALPGNNLACNGNTSGAAPVPSGNGLSGHLTSGNSLQPSGSAGIFGTPVQKENMWSQNNVTANPFGSNTPKPAFSFGSSTSFNSNSFAPPLGNAAQTPPNNIFGMIGQSSQPSPFGGSMQQAPAPAVGMFGAGGTSSVVFGASATPGATSTFGAPKPAFEQRQQAAPSFNFQNPQASTPLFSFGQQPQPTQQDVYSFGGPVSNAPQVQFAMGSAPKSARPVRKAVRRNTPR